jgi:hypothetical protein
VRAKGRRTNKSQSMIGFMTGFIDKPQWQAKGCQR